MRRAALVLLTTTALAAGVACSSTGSTPRDDVSTGTAVEQQTTTTDVMIEFAEATTVSTEPPSDPKVRYIVTANTICGAAMDDIRTFAMDLIPFGNADPIEFATITDHGNASITDAIAELRATPTAPGDEDAAAALYHRMEAVVGDREAFVAAVRAGDAAQADSVRAEIVGTTAALDYDLAVIGIGKCGRVLGDQVEPPASMTQVGS